MWATAANNKKYNDALADYNSLKDPHLNSYFRRPQIKRQLIKANIINKENKIVEEISKTKNKQRAEREHKRELYQLLDDLIKRNRQLDVTKLDNGEDQAEGARFGRLRWNANYGKLANGVANINTATSIDINSKEDLLRHAKMMFNGHGGGGGGSGGGSSRSSKVGTSTNLETANNERDMLLQRLDRMIRTVKEYNYGLDAASNNSRCRYGRNFSNKQPIEANLRSSKSYQDVREKNLEQQQQLERRQQIKKSYSSTSQLVDKVLRPKSSYGRHRQSLNLNSSQPNLVDNEDNIEQLDNHANLNQLKKAKSLADFSANNEIDDDNGDDVIEIDSLDGESLNDSNDEATEINSSNQSSYGVGRASTNSRTSIENTNKKYYAYDRRFIRNSSRQKVKMTLKYNKMVGTTNRNVRANIKVFQQVTVGGNSILIYDGNVKSGDLFSFDVRPHPNNSFAIIVILNGIRDLRLNTCCEHKHRRGTRLSHFTIVDVVGSRPCISCQTQVQVDFDKVQFKKFHRDLFVTDADEELIVTDYKTNRPESELNGHEDNYDVDDNGHTGAHVQNDHFPNYNGDEVNDTFGDLSSEQIDITNNADKRLQQSYDSDDNETEEKKIAEFKINLKDNDNPKTTAKNNSDSNVIKLIRNDNSSMDDHQQQQQSTQQTASSLSNLTDNDDEEKDNDDQEFLEIEKQIQAEEEEKKKKSRLTTSVTVTSNGEIGEFDKDKNNEPVEHAEKVEKLTKVEVTLNGEIAKNGENVNEEIEEVDEINCDYIFDETLPTVIDVDSDSD